MTRLPNPRHTSGIDRSSATTRTAPSTGEPVPARETSLEMFVAPADHPYSWLREMVGTIHNQMLTRGAVLIRGLPLAGPGDLVRARNALGVGIHSPTEEFTLRDDFGDGIVSPIRWPHDRILCPFQESVFSRTFPSVALTACITAPEGGGRQHISDTRRIVDHLPVDLADRVRVGGWTLKRVFHEGFGISWREAYSVTNRTELDGILETENIEARWLPDGTLHTSRHRPGVIEHTETGEECWFNQIAFLNAGSLDPAERAIMANAFGEHLPMNTFFGDGSPLREDDLTSVQHAYESVKTEILWRSGDLLIADNVIAAQGRSASTGTSDFLIALGGPLEV